MILSFVHHGEPVGKQSVKCDCRGKEGRAVQRPRTRQFERDVRWTAKAVMAGRKKLTGAVWIRLTFYVAIPASAPKYKRVKMRSGELRPTKKPDCSNVLKSVEDAMQGVVFDDDAQVCGGGFQKFYADRPRIEVTVGPIGERGDG